MTKLQIRLIIVILVIITIRGLSLSERFIYLLQIPYRISHIIFFLPTGNISLVFSRVQAVIIHLKIEPLVVIFTSAVS